MNLLHNLQEVEQYSRCLYSRSEVEAALDAIALRIENDLGEKSPVVIGVMRGALPMLGYLLPRLSFFLEVDYVHATRYQANLSAGELRWLHEPHLSLKGRSVLVVDDILDRGITLKAIAEKCYEFGASEVKIAVLCKKKIADFEPVTQADYIALDVPDAYVFGYGMDYEGSWRNAPGIYALNHP